MEKEKFSKQYQRRIEKAEKEHKKKMGDWSNAPEAFYSWPYDPRKRSDVKELKRQLRDMLDKQPNERDRERTNCKLDAIEEALRAKDTRRALFLTIAVFIVAVLGVAATIYFGLLQISKP